MRRKLVLILALLIMVSVCIIPVSANGVPPMPFYSIALSNLPEGTVYVDLLVKLPQDDSAYTPLVAENLPDGFAEGTVVLGEGWMADDCLVLPPLSGVWMTK